MKLKQKEYCHNCNQYVEFEFEDTTSKQVIICPKCGHEHWREIDMDTLIRIRTKIKVESGAKVIYEVEEPPLEMIDFNNENDFSKIKEMKIKEKKIVDIDEHGYAIVEGDEKSHARISDRRWGRDPRQ